MILGEMFVNYVPAQQAKDTSELRQAAKDFYEVKGLLNPRELELSMLVAYFMLNSEDRSCN